jgi:hypothetical protein
MAGEPLPSQVHIDTALTDFSVAFLQNPAASIALRAFPAKPVPKQSDKYFVWSAADLLRTEAIARAPGTQAAERTFSVSSASYYCDVIALAHNLSAQTLANSDDPQLEENIVRMLLQDMLIKQERDFSAVAFANNWGTYTTPSTAWSNSASYPITDLHTAIRTVLINTGKRPNVLALGADTWYKGLTLHEDILARLPDGLPRIISKEFMANLLGLDELLVSELVYNSAQEGLAASNAFAATATSALVFFRDPAPGLMSATAGTTFVWNKLSPAGVQVKRYDVELIDAMPRLEVEYAYDVKAVSSALGYLLYTCVS